MMDVRTDVQFFVNKVRELFDVSQRIALAEKVLQEVFNVPVHSWGTEEEGIYRKRKRAYAKYIYRSDDDKLFIGEDNEGTKYYVDYIEFKVIELDSIFYTDWYGERTFDEHPKIVYEMWKDIEAYGLIWRLSVRVGLRSEKDNEVEEDGFEEALAKYQKRDPEFIEWLGKICETNRLII
jgi:hypothetical protein